MESLCLPASALCCLAACRSVCQGSKLKQKTKKKQSVRQVPPSPFMRKGLVKNYYDFPSSSVQQIHLHWIAAEFLVSTQAPYPDGLGPVCLSILPGVSTDSAAPVPSRHLHFLHLDGLGEKQLVGDEMSRWEGLSTLQVFPLLIVPFWSWFAETKWRLCFKDKRLRPNLTPI